MGRGRQTHHIGCGIGGELELGLASGIPVGVGAALIPCSLAEKGLSGRNLVCPAGSIEQTQLSLIPQGMSSASEEGETLLSSQGLCKRASGAIMSY